MKEIDIKKNILQEIMDMMDAKESEGLKQHPKFMAAKLEIAKPDENSEEDKGEDPSKKFSMDDMKEGVSEVEDPFSEKDLHSKAADELSPEEMQKLLELYKQMKA